MSSRWLLASLMLSLGCATQGPPVSFSDKDAAADVDDVEDAADDTAAADKPPTSELPGCASPEIVCGGTCTDITVNLQHCGRCNNRCASGQSCTNGTCTDPAPTCAAPRRLCSTACVDVTTDVTHCGACGNRCPTGQSCMAGACRAPTPTGASPRVMCGASCTDVSTDAANCGVCGLACATGQRCAGGNCTGGTCTPPQVSCGGLCTDTSFDANNCGTCGVRCASGQPCIAGRCGTTPGCTLPLRMCGAACTDVNTDVANCGACGLRCATGQTCVVGRCMTATTGGTRAGAACTNPDPAGGADPACGTLVCIPTGSLPMCTDNCTNSPSQVTERSMCGGGNATCLTQGDGAMADSICAQACTPGPSTGCRPGFACTGWWYTHAGAMPDSPGCFPFCTSDAQCPSGRRCNVRTGSCGATGADLTRLADGAPCNPSLTVMVPGEATPRNVQCRGICFRVSNTVATQGTCGSFVDAAVGRACPDDPANVDLLAPPGTDNLALCVFRNCVRNSGCQAPHVCRYPEDAAGVPDRTQTPQCEYPSAAQRTGIP